MSFEGGVCVSGFFLRPRRFGIGDSTVEALRAVLRWKEGLLGGGLLSRWRMESRPLLPLTGTLMTKMMVTMFFLFFLYTNICKILYCYVACLRFFFSFSE